MLKAAMWCWESNKSLLKEQPVLLLQSSEQSLQPIGDTYLHLALSNVYLVSTFPYTCVDGYVTETNFSSYSFNFLYSLSSIINYYYICVCMNASLLLSLSLEVRQHLWEVVSLCIMGLRIGLKPSGLCGTLTQWAILFTQLKMYRSVAAMWLSL